MRNVFSRRDFLKASAAAVLAASAAGVLTGCDGGGSEIPSATIGLGEFEVTMTGNMTITGDEVVGNENANGYLCKPNVRIRYNGAASEIKYNFAGVFVAKIDKTALELTNGKEEISSKLTKTYVPQFRAKASGYGSFKQGVPTVGGVECSEETVKDGSYEVQRPFVFVTNKSVALSEQAQAFFDFATSADAADLIRTAGAVPVNE